MISKRTALAALAALAAVGPAHAAVTISTAATQNMSCSGGVCEPTATDAVLNVLDLENFLAAGDLTVTTAGSGVDAEDIEVKTAFSWSVASALSMNASDRIYIDSEISSATGNVSLMTAIDVPLTNLRFGRHGRVALSNLSSQLTINGTAYTLVNTVANLASAIASNPSGFYAFADNYDASQDGIYAASPIQAVFSGTFEGLGNTISHLSIDDQSTQQLIGLFSYVVQPAIIEHVRLASAKIVGGARGDAYEQIGTLVSFNASGYLFQDSAAGTIHLFGQKGLAGGLVGGNDGYIDRCFAQVAIKAERAKDAPGVGGLTGANDAGTITQSFATGDVTGSKSNRAGGLVGSNDGPVENSYATGSVTAGSDAEVGGFIGHNKSGIEFSYSTGAVSGGTASVVGGFAGANSRTQVLSDNYWDTTTSGTTQGVGKGGTKNITGLTTEQLQSGLPSGFDPKVWAEDSSINNGLPYLINNPPPK